MAEVETAQADSQKVNIVPIEGKIVELWKAMRKEGYMVSDRKWRNCLRYLKANAYLEGRTECTEDDLEILCHMFWNTPEQIKPVKKLILTYINPEAVKAQEMYDVAIEIVSELSNFSRDDDAGNRDKFGMTLSAKATEVHAKLVRTKKALSTAQSELVKQSKSTKRIDETITEVEAMIQKVVVDYLFN